MNKVATTAQMKELDRIAIEERGIPSLELMEHAAGKVAERVHKVLDKSVTKRITVLCGTGNNGGDGIAAARILKKEGCDVRVFLVGKREKMTPDSLKNEKRLQETELQLEDFSAEDDRILRWLQRSDCIVDALFGVGLKRALAGDFLTAVQWMNQVNCPVISCDIPSGVDGDTGEILGNAVRADWTVTFSCGKPGLYQGEGAVCAGKVEIVEIGIPEELIREFL
ncbi:MAG: NAD(P)H-hydrate epimerase [Lachnospiraceae bacterium]|nr:NAD(P)H-hydrate epimerase [Lachnospiraceae bacterium]